MKLGKPLSGDEIPPGIMVDRFGPDLMIVRNWRNVSLRIQAPASMLLIGMFGTALVFIVADERPAALVPYFGLPLGALVSVGVGYSVLCRVLNRTTIAVSQDRVRVSHGPMPCFRSRNLATSGIAQLFCVARTHPRKCFVRFSYGVMAWNHDDSQELLIAGIDDERLALFIERQIERHLGLSKQKERTPPGFMRRERRQVA